MKHFFLCLIAFSIFFSCKDDDQSESTASFNQTDFLKSYAASIQTDFNHLEEKNNEFQEQLLVFNQNNTEQNLILLKDKWKILYSAYMKVTPYNFGTTGTQTGKRPLVYEINTFPVNVELIEENIALNNSTIQESRIEARGLNAVEYLLFAENRKTLTVQELSYLNLISERINEVIVAASSDWSGNYYTEFVNGTGTNVKSSTTQFFNSWLQSLSTLKTLKVGMPLGKFDANNQINPLLVENPYSETSLEHLREHFNTLKTIWIGKNNFGWKEYVSSLPNGSATTNKITNQFELISNLLQNLDNETLQVQIVDNTNEIDELYNELQQLELFIRVDMSSLLGLAVTATDQDGD